MRGPNADELLVSYSGTSGTLPPVYWINDPQGSAITVAQADGTTSGVWTYDEYGQRGPSNGLRIQYTGQLWLPDFGVYHYKARAYHLGLGRFLQTDPVGYEAGMNLYGYVGNDPVNRTDSTGMYFDTIVQLKGYKLGEAPIIGEFGHSYVQVTDTDTGESYIFRGGPSGDGYLGGQSGAASNRGYEGNACGESRVTIFNQVDPAGESPDTGYSRDAGGSEVLQS